MKNKLAMWRLIPLLLLASYAQAAWVKEIEITSDPEEGGKKIYTVRFTPGRTVNYDEMTFECVYHQEFPWETPRGKKYTKIHEPVTFTFRHAVPRLVHDLDFYSNFRVPISLERLIRIHGEMIFNKAYPITIARIKISAYLNGDVAWCIILKPDGKYDVADQLPEPEPEEPEKKEP